MKLIIGGAYQGKTAYAQEHYGDLDMVKDFHLEVLEWVKQGIDPVTYVKENMTIYQGQIIVSDDVSCGVVPIDPVLRKWREEMGRTLTLLAKESSEVVRVFCGLGTRLK